MGYAFPSYDLMKNVRHWRYRNEETTLPADAVFLHEVPGLRYWVGKWEDVKAYGN